MTVFGGLAIVAHLPSDRLAVAQELDLHPAHTHEGTCLQPGPIVSTLSPVSSVYVVDGESMVVPEIVGSPDGIPVEYSSTTLPVSLAQINRKLRVPAGDDQCADRGHGAVHQQ
jgi:hypothetical protein